MQPLSSIAAGINIQYQQSLLSFNSGIPGLPVPLWPLQLTTVPTHSPAINLDVGNRHLHQMSDGTFRTSSGSEASSSTGAGLSGNCSGVA